MTAEMELKAEFIAVPSSLEQPGNPELTLALSEAIWFKKNYFSLKIEVTYSHRYFLPVEVKKTLLTVVSNYQQSK